MPIKRYNRHICLDLSSFRSRSSSTRKAPPARRAAIPPSGVAFACSVKSTARSLVVSMTDILEASSSGKKKEAWERSTSTPRLHGDRKIPSASCPDQRVLEYTDEAGQLRQSDQTDVPVILLGGLEYQKEVGHAVVRNYLTSTGIRPLRTKSATFGERVGPTWHGERPSVHADRGCVDEIGEEWRGAQWRAPSEAGGDWPVAECVCEIQNPGGRQIASLSAQCSTKRPRKKHKRFLVNECWPTSEDNGEF
ncbi:hypothetical protein KC356_g194 [Hortaea werneckii]|nr:hypothetical protein KC356_g194 [Hortaea werneckii]